MEFYSLKKPKPSNIDSKKIINTLFQKDGRFLHEFSNKMNSPEYLYWDKIRYKQPAPKGYSREELWMVYNGLKKLDTDLAKNRWKDMIKYDQENASRKSASCVSRH